MVLNLTEARFECSFGRGCEGVCCRKGRPPIYPEEASTIQTMLPRLLALLRPEARLVVAARGFLSGRRKAGQPTLRVAGGWCVFFNRGCVLQRAGSKPWTCAVFPLSKDQSDRWYVRQKGYKGEMWDLFCLDPRRTARPAAETLREEIALASSL